MITLSYTIPCYNCEKYIATLVHDIIETVTKENNRLREAAAVNVEAEKVRYRYEIVCVNDGSTDGTLDALVTMAKADENIRVISLAENVGQHVAIVAAMKFVRGDVVINLDDDGQTDPKQSFILINELLSGKDFVFAKYPVKKERLFRKIGSFVHWLSFHIFHGTDFFYLSSYFACTKEAAKEISAYRAFCEATSSRLFWKNKNVVNVTVIHKERVFGKSTYTLAKLVKLFLSSVGLRRGAYRECKVDQIYN